MKNAGIEIGARVTSKVTSKMDAAGRILSPGDSGRVTRHMAGGRCEVQWATGGLQGLKRTHFASSLNFLE